MIEHVNGFPVLVIKKNAIGETTTHLAAIFCFAPLTKVFDEVVVHELALQPRVALGYHLCDRDVPIVS